MSVSQQIAAHGDKMRAALDTASQTTGPYTIYRQATSGPETTYAVNISQEAATELMDLINNAPYKHHQDYRIGPELPVNTAQLNLE